MVEWVSVPKYIKMSGLSKKNIEAQIQSGELIAVRTDGNGQLRIKVEKMDELDSIREELAEMREYIKKIGNHLGVRA